MPRWRVDYLGKKGSRLGTVPPATFTHIPDGPMSPTLARAAHYRAYAAASLGNAETARDRTIREVHLAIARHFYALTENEIDRLERRVESLVGTDDYSAGFLRMLNLAPGPGNDWTEEEHAHIRRLGKVCHDVGQWELECKHTDAGDPWCIIYDQDQHGVVLHIARIDPLTAAMSSCGRSNNGQRPGRQWQPLWTLP